MEMLSIQRVVSLEENLVRILDNLDEGIIAHDLARKILFINKKTEQITGYTRDEVLGRDCHDAFGSAFCGERCSFCNGSSPTLPEKIEYPVSIQTKSGESRKGEMVVSRMDDENGCFVGVIACFKDVSEIYELRRRAGQITEFSGIIGRDRKMIQVFEQIRDMAEYDYPVHVHGETGTGKECVAGAIHNESRRAGAPFVPINCGALPEGLIESELFGHVKGSFSGAIRDKKGRFELADGGTVLLDEVADLPKQVQVKLLRFLQEGTFERVGGEKTISVDVRIVSATNKDLKKEIKKGNFREDLYYRINVLPIHLPPLRKRVNDIPLLVDHFLNQAAELSGKAKVQISSEALAMMVDYRWPGNVRELQNAVQFSIVKSRGKLIAPSCLPLELQSGERIKPQRGPSKKLDLEAVSAALVKAGGNRSKAARILGVGRATLYRFFTENPEAEKIEV